MPVTYAVHRTSLLESLLDPADAEGLSRFTARYRPVLLGFGRRVGVGEEADLRADQTLARFLEEHRNAPTDEREGDLRDRLFAAAMEVIAGGSLAALAPLSSSEDLRVIWDAEWRRAIVRHALEELYRDPDSDSRVLQAFELHCLERRPANEVAAELGMSRTAVFSAKQRLMEHLRTRVAQLEEEF